MEQLYAIHNDANRNGADRMRIQPFESSISRSGVALFVICSLAAGA